MYIFRGNDLSFASLLSRGQLLEFALRSQLFYPTALRMAKTLEF